MISQMKRIIKEQDTPPLCGCNCGQSVQRSKVTGQWNKFVHGHNSRSSSNDAKFKPGNKCGKGRAEGSRNRVTISAMNLLKDEEQVLSRRAIDAALAGNTQMLQFCLSRILPPPPKDEAIKLDGIPACTDMNSAQALSSYVLERLADGKLTPSQANIVSGIVERHVRCLQVTDLDKRLTLLEDTLLKNS